jgi:hypothetical protein
MTQFNTPVARRSGGDLDVYAGLLAVAMLVLIAGVAYMAMSNIKHSSSSANANDGGVLKLVQGSSR